jgi:hypothetical protein
MRQGGSTRLTLGICRASADFSNVASSKHCPPPQTRGRRQLQPGPCPAQNPIQPFFFRLGIEAASGPLGMGLGATVEPEHPPVTPRHFARRCAGAVYPVSTQSCTLGITFGSASSWHWRQADPEHPVMSVLLGLESHVGTCDAERGNCGQLVRYF